MTVKSVLLAAAIGLSANASAAIGDVSETLGLPDISVVSVIKVTSTSTAQTLSFSD